MNDWPSFAADRQPLNQDPATEPGFLLEKKMSKTAAAAALSAWMTAWMVYGLTKVGETSTVTTFTWALPWTILMVLGFSACLGFWLGRASKKGGAA